LSTNPPTAFLQQKQIFPANPSWSTSFCWEGYWRADSCHWN
jgi:hypothetical protein